MWLVRRVRRSGFRSDDEKARPVFDELEAWLQARLPRLSGKTRLAGAIRHALNRMPKARACLGDGRLELDNNICERSIRPIALGRKNCLFMGSVGGGKAAAIACTLVETARMNGVDPEAWLTWVLERLPDHKMQPHRGTHAVELEAGITEKYGSNGRLRKGRPAAGEGQASVFDDLEVWLQAQLPRLSGKTKLAEAIRYALKPMPEARAYLGDGRLKLDNNICERSIRPVAPGRKNCLFPGSVGGGEAAAIAYALIETAKMKGTSKNARTCEGSYFVPACSCGG